MRNFLWVCVVAIKQECLGSFILSVLSCWSESSLVCRSQGFEVVIHGRKFFAFSKYEGTLTNSTSYCDQTLPGWSHDVLGHDWACYRGKKTPPSLRNHQPYPKQSNVTWILLVLFIVNLYDLFHLVPSLSCLRCNYHAMHSFLSVYKLLSLCLFRDTDRVI